MDEPTSSPQPEAEAIAPEPAIVASPSATPWVTGLAIAACGIVFVGLQMESNRQSWGVLARWGYLPASEIWSGRYWALLTSVFVHLDTWHVAFNVYWLWLLGSRMERAIGSARYLAFFLVAGFVSSAYQLAVSDSTGHGASGVAYALFGFMWITRQRHPVFYEVVHNQNVQLFLVWLVGCMAATYLNIWNVGNAAHFSGLVFGVLAAAVFELNYKRWLTGPLLATMIIASAVPLVWAPWSPTWLGIQAYRAHHAGRFIEAREFYTRMIQRDPKNAWAYKYRASANGALGDTVAAEKDWEESQRLGADKKD